MPTYQNKSKYRRIIGTDPVEPEASIKLLAYYNIRGLDGVSITDDFPYYSPIIISEKIEKSVVIEIPQLDFFGNFIDKFSIHFYVEVGEPIVDFNTPKNKTPLKLYPGAKWNIRNSQRLVNKIFITSENIFKLWLIIEKL